MAEDTWEPQDLPILEAVRAGELAGDLLDSTRAGAAAGLDETAAGWAVQTLVEAGYLTGAHGGDLSATYQGFFNLRLTAEGRRVVGQWPTDPAERFLAELDRRIAAEADPVKRGVLERARGAMADVAKQVLAEVIVYAGTRGMS